MNDPLHLYVHIPFCQSKCPYCDFVSFKAESEEIEKYINLLVHEIQLIFTSNFNDYHLASIYFGGGTPSWIHEKYIAKILDEISRFFTTSGIEKTIELNPNVEKHKIEAYQNIGINRLSIGSQSFNTNKLKFLERDHTVDDTIQLLEEIERIQFPNVSLDIIFGLSDEETLDDEINTLRKYRHLIKHISAYELTLEKSVPLFKRYNKKYLCKEERGGELYTTMIHELQKLGYEQYEISNFAKPGFESAHNLSYWSWKNYIGVGISASSFVNSSPYGIRWKNTNSIHEYLHALDEKRLPRTLELLDRKTALNDYVISVLRKNEGISLAHFKSVFTTDFYNIFPESESFISNNLLVEENSMLRLTKEGRMIFDSIVERLL